MGFQVFLLGWTSVFYGVVAWFANVGYILTFVLVFIKNKLSLAFSVVTLVVALTSFTYPVIEKGENGYDFYIADFHSGFYLWLTAIFILCTVALIQVLQRYNGKRDDV